MHSGGVAGGTPLSAPTGGGKGPDADSGRQREERALVLDAGRARTGRARGPRRRA